MSLVVADRWLDVVGEVVDRVSHVLEERRRQTAAPKGLHRVLVLLEVDRQCLAGDAEDDQPEKAEDDDLEEAPEAVPEIGAKSPEEVAHGPKQQRREAGG